MSVCILNIYTQSHSMSINTLTQEMKFCLLTACISQSMTLCVCKTLMKSWRVEGNGYICESYFPLHSITNKRIFHLNESSLLCSIIYADINSQLLRIYVICGIRTQLISNVSKHLIKNDLFQSLYIAVKFK